MDIFDELGKEIIFFDGAMGSLIQAEGIFGAEYPEAYNITHSEVITDIHRKYLRAGANIITTNTFGAYSHKFGNLEEIIKTALENAKRAVSAENSGAKIAFDMGPIGRLIKPLGDMDFEECVNLYKKSAVLGEKYGADIILTETLNDIYEMKAAVTAVKESTNLRVFATMTLDENAKLISGGDIMTMVSVLEGLGVKALGLNCGFGPKQFEGFLEDIVKYSSLPVILQPNAGLPEIVNGETVFPLKPQEFALIMSGLAKKGACILGGCCGTTPEHIKAMADLCKDIKPPEILNKEYTVVSSYGKSHIIGEKPLIIGERINPTGKKEFKKALINGDITKILEEAVKQTQAGARILDVNVGLPEIDEKVKLTEAVKEIQAVCDLPLQIDTSDISAMESAMRIYNGKPLINSVSGKDEVMEAVFPLVKKYGGVVVGLTLDSEGIPDTVEKRLEIAERIINTAEKFGVSKKDIVIDPLALTISAQQKESLVTLETLKRIKEELKVKTVLGVSNISFGLPEREFINAAFFSMALAAGLDLCIINPLASIMKGVYDAYLALSGYDENCMDYIEAHKDKKNQPAIDKKESQPEKDLNLFDDIVRGLSQKAFDDTNNMLNFTKPMDIINGVLIKALDFVGEKYETGEYFLPQLMKSAEAAGKSFTAIKAFMDKSGLKQEKKGGILLATVEGDSHDIGKNIVRALLENYGYDINDLGKNVPVSKVVEEVVKGNFKLVGLSALMTTTVLNMEKTIKEIKAVKPECVVMVGGAVINETYAKKINADYYSKDALGAVNIAKEVFGNII